tara:strand:+ start:332 stop:1084 length:753 start_codon:yes stop_codon:yes gene_type:complete
MNFKILILLFISLFLYNCDNTRIKNTSNSTLKVEQKFKNTGFALIYNKNLENIKDIDDRSLDIYHKSLKRKSIVKITNPNNGKYLLANVKSNKVKFSEFYNSIISSRIAETLELNTDEPFIEIRLISKNSTFIAKKAKTFDAEKNVANKAPIDGIQVNDLKKTKIKKKSKNDKKFSYSIKLADFYYKKTAQLMINRIKNETSIKKYKIIKISKTKFRVLIGPFDDIHSIKESFEQIKLLEFENIEIIKNV